MSVGRLAGIGVGVVGPVEAEPDLASARRQIRDALPDVVRPGADVPVFVDNNTRLAALAEAIWGAGAGVAHLCYLRLSHGVGGGLVVDGHLLGGAWGAAGELGHVSVDPDGPECACGGRGCLERFVNLTTFLDRAGARSIEDAAAAWRAGDPRCRAAVADAGQLLGRALGAAASILNPEAVVLGGELAALGDPLLDAIRGPLGHFGHQRVVDGLQLRAAALGDDSAAQGGVALVLRRSALLAGYPALRPPAAAAS